MDIDIQLEEEILQKIKVQQEKIKKLKQQQQDILKQMRREEEEEDRWKKELAKLRTQYQQPTEEDIEITDNERTYLGKKYKIL